MTTKKKTSIAAAALALAGAALLLLTPPSPAPLPVLGITSAGLLHWQAQPGIRYDVECVDLSGASQVIGTTTNGSFQVGTATGYYRVRLTQPGEIALPDGTSVVSRKVVRRGDGLNAYLYPVAGAMRLALWRDIGAPVTYDITLGFASLGCEADWCGNSLYVIGSHQDVGTVLEFSVSAEWPPVVTPGPVEFFEQPANDLRWPSIAALPDGRIAAVWYLQGNGMWAKIAYRTAAGVWSYSEVDVAGIEPSTQSAGTVMAAAVGDKFMVGGIKDSWGLFALSVFIPGESLTLDSRRIIVNQWPDNGVIKNRECVPHGEVPMSMRLWAENGMLRVLYNQYDYLVTYPQGYFLSLTRLTLFDVAGNGDPLFKRMTTNLWTERVIPDYGYAGGKIFIVPIDPGVTNFPKPSKQILMREDGVSFGPIDYWTPLAFSMGASGEAVVYPRGGLLWLNRL